MVYLKYYILSIEIVVVLNFTSKHCSEFLKFIKITYFRSRVHFLFVLKFTFQIYESIYLFQYSIIYYSI
jgi:hypothetical protein